MPTVSQASDNFDHREVCAPKQWLAIVALIVLVGWILSAHAAHTVDITAEEIVQRADRIRFPAEGFQVDVQITTTSTSDDTEVKAYRVLSKGNERTLLMTTAPVIDRGTILLMRDHDLWVFMPNISQPVRLPLSQRLTGEVANGDLARANFTGDYNSVLLRTETIEKKSYYVLELTAASKGVTYHRILYWVNQTNFRPYRAEFYSLSNRLIKTCLYQKYQKSVGVERPSQLVMIDALNTGNRSVLDYSNMQLRSLPDKVFTKDYLKKLSK
jgi:hypothetical protein